MNNQEIIELRKKVLEKEFSRMNSVQKQAVFSVNGPLLVLAGAGSGKTTVVVSRIANIAKYGNAYKSDYVNPLINENDISAMKDFLNGGEMPISTEQKLSVNPSPAYKIMAITFTNKAAKELKERLSAVLGPKSEDLWASTFHASCARILRRDGEKIGFTSRFVIYDMDDSKRLMKDCLKTLDISEKIMPPKAVLSEISRAKDSLTSPKEYKQNSGDDHRLRIIANAYKLYQDELKKANAMDFDDLIVNTVKLFKECPEVLEYYQNRFNYITVDEYQDTNHAQYMFIKLLSDKHKNLCVVGDDDQSIYKFRGATIENILSFEENFSNAKVVRLEQNYRSSGNILNAANKLIENNRGRKGKNLWTDKGDGEPVTIHTVQNETDEADAVATEILRQVAEGRRYSDFAVLYRMNSQSLSFERMFAKQAVPHRILGGTRFYDRMEIKDMLAYLNLINNPSDTVRIKRIINRPTRGIGAKTADVVAEIASNVGLTYLEVIFTCENYPQLSRAAKKLREFGIMIKHLIEFSENPENSIQDLYSEILDVTDYKQWLKDDEPEKAEDRIENIMELSSNIKRYENECIANDKEPTLFEFLEEISLITDIDNYDNDADTVTLMTIHSAKGLEFPVVFLPGWEESVFPSVASIYNESETEEERRLAYVAITRAKEQLFIHNAQSRMIFGSTTRNKLSRFAEEIPNEFIDRKNSGFHSYSSSESTRVAGVSSPRTPSFGMNSASGIKGGFSTPTAKPTAEKQSFSDGDKVLHKTFGEGVILSSRPMGNDTLLEIAFKAGTKLLGANFAKLKKL